MPRLLEEIDFRYPDKARDYLSRLAAAVSESVVNRIELLLASVPDPDRALHYLETLRTESPQSFQRLARSPGALTHLLTVFSYSRFLAEKILRQPEYLLELATEGNLHRTVSCDEYLEKLAKSGGNEPLLLARFRRRQILRIVLRDVLGHATLADVTEELSNLADAILEFSYRRILEDLSSRHGEPAARFAIMSLGKLGGKELNYSSDIDLMFLYSENGETDGPDPISYKEFFKKLANRLVAELSSYTPEGLCYRLDLRLRPDGRLGEVCLSLDGAKTYYQSRARAWELQMLIKARVSAGDRDLGRDFLEFVEPLIYASSLDFRAVEAVSETRARIGEKVAAKRSSAETIDVKLTRGGIRDIEFLVQCLQRLHGGREQWVRHGGTLFALFRLRDKNLLSGSEYARLASAYQFLRHLEHRLQFDEDRQTHTLPSDPDELKVLARKMPADYTTDLTTAESLLTQLSAHLEDVRELYDRVIHTQKPEPPQGEKAEEREREPEPPPSNLSRFLDERAPQLASLVMRSKLHRGRQRFEHFLDRVTGQPEWLQRLENDEPLTTAVLDLFENSAYFSDQLLRYPELLDEIGKPYGREEGLAEPATLRRFFRRQMLRLQSASLTARVPIFETLDRTSDLADTVIAAAYEIALREVKAPAGYAAQDQMLVIALGRLGMREFDLASDADLVFVIPERDAAHHLFWTAVAERIIQTISAYTGDGVLFTVDTRLRPNGREGALVQSDAAYKDYFARHAEAWEGITYMKSRAVAGNAETATQFLTALQDVDWRRYGQGGRSRKELAQMRARVEREQGGKNPLKAGMGGYYDIDFCLMYLRLKGAGIFYKVLNTPERIDVIEKMGHLEREDAEFLSDAATFYRAIDHGLRIASGHAEGSLPRAHSQYEVLNELVRRWTPPRLHEQPLDQQLGLIRRRTRDFFNGTFGASL